MTEQCQAIVNGDYDIILPKDGTELMKMINLFSHRSLPFPKRAIDAWARIHFPSERLKLLRKRKYIVIFDNLGFLIIPN
jgi:hypothetical protein